METRTTERRTLGDEIGAILVEHPQYIDVIDEIEFTITSHAKGKRRLPCIPVYGHAGAGKTTIFKHFKAAYPPVKDGCVDVGPDGITSTSDHVKVLCIDMPDVVTVPNIAREMLRVLGDTEWDKGKDANLHLRVDLLLAACRTAAVLIDEGQRVVDRAGVLTAEGVIDWIKKRHAVGRTSFVMFGIPRMRSLFDQDNQFYRRWDNGLEVRPYRWGTDDGDMSDRLNFMGLLGGFRAEIPVPFAPEVDVSDEAVAKRFYYASRGLAGGLYKLFDAVARIIEKRAWKAGREGGPVDPPAVDLKLLEEAFDKAFARDRKVETLVNPFGPDWDGQLPPPIPDENYATEEAKRQRRKMAGRGRRRRTKVDVRRELDQVLTKR